MGIDELLEEAGVFQYGVADTSAIHFSEAVRDMCAMNRCQEYNRTWACPPAVGTVDECKEKCLKFAKILVFSHKSDLEDSYDYEGMMSAMAEFKKLARVVEEKTKPYLDSYLVLANEGCNICAECTYPDNPCRFPDKLHCSLEGYGIFVNELAGKAGINYINGANTVTYFGAVLFDEFNF